jgi:hypothetical protein
VKKEAGILGTLLFLLSSYPSVADPTPEPTATPELIPTPHEVDIATLAMPMQQIETVDEPRQRPKHRPRDDTECEHHRRFPAVTGRYGHNCKVARPRTRGANEILCIGKQQVCREEGVSSHVWDPEKVDAATGT